MQQAAIRTGASILATVFLKETAARWSRRADA